jgi:hypothetical protein
VIPESKEEQMATTTNDLIEAVGDAIGRTVAALFAYAARENLELTTTPIEVEEDTGGDFIVILHACKSDGADVEVREAVNHNGTIGRALISEWDEDAAQMSSWRFL